MISALSRNRSAGQVQLCPGCFPDVNSMIAYFGRSFSLERVTPGRVDDYVVWLQTEGRGGRRITPKSGQRQLARGYSDATIARRLKRCRQFFRLAVRNGLVADNPFAGVGKGFRQTSPEPNREVMRDGFDRIINQCPDTQWEAIVALSRIGELRCPSEILAITWADVDFHGSKFMPLAPTLRVPSQKTDCHGRPFRIIPSGLNCGKSSPTRSMSLAATRCRRTNM